MVHVSELAHGYVKTPNEIVKEGDEVEAKVLDVNRKKKQIKLSMKALEPEVEEFKPAKKETKKAGKRGPKKDMDDVPAQEEEREPEMTAMQIAWQEASEHWNDEVSRKFCENHLEPLGPVVKLSLDAISRMTQVVSGMHRDCSS